MKAILSLLVLALVTLSAVEASHFRYQTAYYTRSTTNDRTITLTLKQAWRRSAFTQNNVGQVFGELSFQWGDGTSTPIQLTVTSVNTADDWMSGEQTMTHTYGGTATTFNAFYESCCRISTLRDGNNDLNERIFTVVKVGPNSPLSSPQIDALPLIPFALNLPNSVQLPLLPGSDGGPVPFAISPTGNSGMGSGLNFATPNNHGPFSFSSGGLISWTPTLDGLYAFQVAATAPSGVVVSLDIILYVRQGMVNHNPPVITAPSPNVIHFTPGQVVTFNVVATDPDALDDVTIQAGSLPPGAILGPCSEPEPQTTCTSTLTWPTTPTSASQLICFFARDLANNLSQQYCVQLVADPINQPCANGNCPSLKTVGTHCVSSTPIVVNSNGNCATLSFNSAVTTC